MFHPHSVDRLWWTLPFLVLVILYIASTVASGRRFNRWPIHRTLFWILGIGCAASAFIGPIAEQAHHQFAFHMLGHLLLGMLTPLFIALAAPMTLILRVLDRSIAIRLTRLLRSPVIGVITGPVFTAFMNIGGLWLLYTSGLYSMMHQSLWLYILIHIHIFLSGYLFTESLLCIDPSPHKRSFRHRMTVWFLALAGHSILAKHLYAHPPHDIPSAQSQDAGILMFYGGDAVELIVLILLFDQWYKAIRPRTAGDTRLLQANSNPSR